MPRRQVLVAHVDTVVRSGCAAPSSAESTLALTALVQAARLARVVYPGPRGFPARRRLARLVAADRLATATAHAAADDRELADALATGADLLSRRLYDELTDLYADFTTGGHSLGHDLNPSAWSGADTSGHHAAGDHGGSHHGGGGDGW